MYHQQTAALLIMLFGLCVSARRLQTSQCSAVKESFLKEKPAVAATIPDTPQYDGSLELCRFTNHSESKRPSCCTHDTENELLLTAQAEYTKILRAQTADVIDQMAPGKGLPHHFERMMAISKRMTEYEMGKYLNLPHLFGRQVLSNFYTTLENILLKFDRTTSVFAATETLLDNLFVYVVKEAEFPGSLQEPDATYAECVKTHRPALDPSPFPINLRNHATSLHYGVVAASYLSEAMNVTFQALYATRDFQMSHHCLRDLMKLNHCQKCYGYANMKPCREFCEDVFLICLNRVVRLHSNWEYHRKIIKILAEYILTRVEIQSLLNAFHTELKAGFDMAVVEYSSYKKQLKAVCGAPKMSSNSHLMKNWEKPQTTSYEGDFTGDLRKLVVNLELKIQDFYSNLHASICTNTDQPVTAGTCWDGLTERVNKKKKILEFSDEFAPYPDKNEEVFELISHIKRIRNEVLKIFLKSSSNSDDEINASGSGDGEVSEDTEPGDDNEQPPTRPPQAVIPLRNNNNNNNNNPATVTSRLSTIYNEAPKDSSIEIVEPTPKPRARKPPKKADTAEVGGGDTLSDSSASSHRISVLTAWANILFIFLYLIN